MPSTLEENIQYCYSFYKSKDLIKEYLNAENNETTILKSDDLECTELTFDEDQIVLKSSEKPNNNSWDQINCEVKFRNNEIYIFYHFLSNDIFGSWSKFSIQLSENNIQKAYGHRHFSHMQRTLDQPVNEKTLHSIFNLLVNKIKNTPAGALIEEAKSTKALLNTFFKENNTPAPLVSIIASYYSAI